MTEGDSRPPDSADRTSDSYVRPERRGKPRLYCWCPATIRWGEGGGAPSEISAVVNDISASGLYLRLGRGVEQGATLLVTMRFTNSAAAEARGPLVTIHGRVLRVEAQPDGEFGLALSILQHEFV